MKLIFEELRAEDDKRICEMSALAKLIWKEYYEPILPEGQTDYMLGLFLSPEAIKKQSEENKRWFFVRYDGEDIGFISFYPIGDAMYLSKFYLRADMRGRGFAHEIIGFVREETQKLGLDAVELNVNKYNITTAIYEKLGFVRIRSEVNDIGHGFVMDDYVYRLTF